MLNHTHQKTFKLKEAFIAHAYEELYIVNVPVLLPISALNVLVVSPYIETFILACGL
jgi:hypothetical protein